MRNGSSTLKKKVAVGIALSAAPVLSMAAPAGATASNRAETARTVTFTYQGQEVSCSLSAASQYEIADGFTTMSGVTFVAAIEPCTEAIRETEVSGFYRQSSDVPGESFGGGSTGLIATASARVEGGITEFEVGHLVEFACDDPPPDRLYCAFVMVTQPK